MKKKEYKALIEEQKEMIRTLEADEEGWQSIFEEQENKIKELDDKLWASKNIEKILREEAERLIAERTKRDIADFNKNNWSK